MTIPPLCEFGSFCVQPKQQSNYSAIVNVVPLVPLVSLNARGGFEVDMSWQDGRLTGAVIHSTAGQPCRVVYDDKFWDLETTAGRPYQLEVGTT